MGFVEFGVVFLYQEVWGRGVEMETGDRTDCRVCVVRGHKDMPRFRYGGDLLQLGYPARVAHIGLEDVSRVRFHQFVKREFEIKTLSGGNRDVHMLANLGHFAYVLLGDRLLEPEGPVLFESLTKMDCGMHVELGVNFDEYFDVGANGFSNGGDPVLRQLSLLGRDGVIVVLAKWVEFHGCVAHFDDAQRFFSVLFRRAGVGVPAVGVLHEVRGDQRVV